MFGDPDRQASGSGEGEAKGIHVFLKDAYAASRVLVAARWAVKCHLSLDSITT